MSDAAKKLENYKLVMKDGLAPNQLEHLLSARSSAKFQSFSAKYSSSLFLLSTVPVFFCSVQFQSFSAQCSSSLFLLNAVLVFFCSVQFQSFSGQNQLHKQV